MAIELPFVIQQIAYVEQVVQTGENAPLLNQLANQQSSLEGLKEQNSKVQDTEETDPGKKVEGKKESDRRKRQQQRQKRQARSQQPNDEELDVQALADDQNPWAGNIINRKI